jgi:hypothetical protein
MADTLKRLSGPALLTAAAATQYTAPAATTTTLRNIHVCNGTGAARKFTLSIGTDAAGTRLFDGLQIPSYDAFDWSGCIVMNATEILQAFCDVTTSITLTVSGVETA